MPEPATAYISASAIRRNVEAVRRRIPANTAICVAVKADAYGHSLDCVLPVLAQSGVTRVAVANLEEAIDVRGRGWHGQVLSLGPILAADTRRQQAERAAEAVAAGMAATITTVEEGLLLSEAAQAQHRSAHVEIQVDTGMGRCGVLWEKAVDLIAQVSSLPQTQIDGVFMHFATSDEPDLTFARAQFQRFSTIISQITARKLPVGLFHAANSAAIFRLPESHLGMVRPGLCIYGYWAGPDAERPPDLCPVMRVVSRLTEVRRLPAGSSVGYGCTWTAKRDSLIGTASIGYADGYRRLLGGKAVVTLANGRQTPCRSVPVIGRVSMDQINLDLTDAGPAEVGDLIAVVDENPSSPNCVESLAKLVGSIPYEITTLLGSRVRRVPAP